MAEPRAEKEGPLPGDERRAFVSSVRMVPIKLTRNTYLDGSLRGPPQVVAVTPEIARDLIARGFAEAVTVEAKPEVLRTQPTFPVAHAASPAVVTPKKKR